MVTHSCDIQARRSNTSKAGPTSEEALAFQLLARSAGACVFPHICTVSQLQATVAALHALRSVQPPSHHPTAPTMTHRAAHMGDVWASICISHYYYSFTSPVLPSQTNTCFPRRGVNVRFSPKLYCGVFFFERLISS